MSNKPLGIQPVLAKIRGLSDLGFSEWYEVVYYDSDQDRWCSFWGSKTFEDGEIVLGWIYCEGLEQSDRWQKEREA